MLAAKTIYVMLFGSAMVIFLYKRGDATRNDLELVSGRIEGLSIAEVNGTPDPLMRLIRLENYKKLFAMSVARDARHVEPKLTRIDELNAGDSISIYFDTSYGVDDRSVTSVMFIDKGSIPYFILGHGDNKLIAYFIWGIAAISIVGVLVLKKMGKIS